jgi:DNA-binding Lrp family transcriptional regulator
MDRVTTTIDELDARLLHALDASPRVGVLELARQLGVARGTVQARLDGLQRRGIVTSFGPHLDPAELGFAVLGFTTLEIAQGRLHDVVDHLRDLPEVLEAHATSGTGDLHCRVVARTNAHLQDVINRILEVQGIDRSTTVIALSEQINYRVMPLVDAAASASAGGPAPRGRRATS